MFQKIHSYTSQEPMLQVNAFIVEGENELVLVDTTLTMSDSKALKEKIDSLGKPLAAILLTHGHPDHIAGTYNIAPDGDIPIYALQSVHDQMAETEATKHAQWAEMFGDEWIPKWIYPNHIVADGDEIAFGDLRFRVLEIGSGGDSDANAIWLLDTDQPVAFLGDFLYKENHSYMADGSIMRWLANLERFTPTLAKYDTYYIGHGPSATFADIQKQKEYFIEYTSELIKSADADGILTEDAKTRFEKIMHDKYPSYGCQFMVGLAAETVLNEIKSK